MDSLRELFINLGLSVESAEFAEAIGLEHALEEGAELCVEAVEHMGEVFVEAVEKTAEFGEKMELLSIKTGVSVEEIQKLSYAATLSGSSADDMKMALTHLSRAVENAKDGSEEAQKHFQKLGISMDDVRTKSPDELFKLMADRIKEIGPGSKATALAMQILGRSGANMIPTLIEGREGLEELGEELVDFGGLMDKEATHGAHEFADNLQRVHAIAEGLEHELAGPLIEALNPLLKDMFEWVKLNREFIGLRVRTFAHALGEALVFVGHAVAGLAKAVMVAIDYFKLFAYIIGSVVGAVLISNAAGIAFAASWYIALGVQAVTAAIASAAAWTLAAAPIALIAAALLFAALFAEDFYYFMTDGESVLGHLIEKGQELMKVWFEKHTDPWIVTTMKEAIKLANMLATAIAIIDPTGLLGLAFAKIDEKTAPGPQKVSLEEAAAQTSAALSHMGKHTTADDIYGSGGSPGASAAAGATNYVHAPSFSMPVTIVQGPGQSASGVAEEVGTHFERLWDSKMREAAPGAGK